MTNTPPRTTYTADLQLLFNHFTNYLVCASLFYIGSSALQHPEWLHMGDMNSILAYFVIIISIILAALNGFKVIHFIFVNFKPISVPGRRRRAGLLVRYYIISAYLALMYVIISVAVNIQDKT